MVAYYAHTKDGESEAQWEPLLCHLQEVAELAAELAARFGAADFAHAAGLLHDFGKYSTAFQDRLRGAPGRVDHSTAGAVWAAKHLPQKWGRLIAHAVAGHHAGLADTLFDSGGRLEIKADLAAQAACAAQADGLIFPPGLSKPEEMRILRDQAGFQRAFLTRMIFSCLIDADRSAAAAFEAGATGRERPESTVFPSITELNDALHAAIAARQARATPLNTLRDRVLEAALSKAADPPGAFTLTVPTGGGKTLTSLAFALAHARAHGLDPTAFTHFTCPQGAALILHNLSIDGEWDAGSGWGSGSFW